MNNVERYEALLRSAFEAQQLKIELRRKLAEIAKDITANELKHRSFNNEDARKAFEILSGGTIEIKKNQYVKATATYNDVEIHLRELPQGLGSKAMSQVLSNLTDSEIFNA